MSRRNVVSIRLTDEELAALDRYAERIGLSRSVAAQTLVARPVRVTTLQPAKTYGAADVPLTVHWKVA